MRIRVMQKCDCSEECEAKDYFVFKSKLFEVSFVDDYGYKILHIRVGKKIWGWNLN